MTDEEREIVTLYRDKGLSLRQVRAATGRSINFISRVLLLADVEIRAQRGRPKGSENLERDREIVRLSARKSYYAIAKQFGLSENRVREIVRLRQAEFDS